jgi:hypothetical protein
MPDTSPTPAPAPVPPANPAKTLPRSYFNQAQIADIALAEDVATAAADADVAALLATRDITADYVAGLAALVTQARTKMTETGQANHGPQPTTLNAAGAERALVIALQGIQSAAKQRQRMEQEDDDPTTNFTTDGYLLGLRLNRSRELFLQNAETLLTRVRADALPGYRTAAPIEAVEAALAAYRAATASQADAGLEAAQDRIARDAMVRKINARRLAIQHAFDGLRPYTEEAHHPLRRRFRLPIDRPFNG